MATRAATPATPRPVGTFGAPTVATVTVSGRVFEVTPGVAFDKAVHQAAADAGLNGRYYVRLARQAGEAAEFVTVATAPEKVEAGMEISLSPHSQGA